MFSHLKWPLVWGDLVILTIFTAGGMAFHEVEGSWAAEFFRIGWPFFVGYVLCAASLGAWSDGSRRELARRGGLTWLVGIGLGLLLRIVQTSRVPVMSFVLITFAFTGLCFFLWRGFYLALSAASQGDSRR